MFKSRKKKQQQKEEERNASILSSQKIEIVDTSKYKLLDDIHLSHDFRTSVILPQLSQKRSILDDTIDQTSPPFSPTSVSQMQAFNSSSLSIASIDGNKQYQDLAAWRSQRKNRYSNGLFGGKQRGKPTPQQAKKASKLEKEEYIKEAENEDVSETTTTIETESKITLSDNLVLSPLEQQQLQDNLQDLGFDEDEEQDFDDYSQHQLAQEAYEPGSDNEENFFFQDFAAGANKTQQPTKKKMNNKNTRQSQNRRFDLSSFAKDLHAQRLSVIQPRDSRIIMTEDDEHQLEKLLELQRQRMSMVVMDHGSTDSLATIAAPPLPPLNLIKKHVVAPLKKESAITDDLPVMNSDHGSSSTATGSIVSAPSSQSSAISVVSQQENDGTSEPSSPLPSNSARPSVSAGSGSDSAKSKYSSASTLRRSISIASVRSSYNENLCPIESSSPTIPDDDEITKHKKMARRSQSMSDLEFTFNQHKPYVAPQASNRLTKDRDPIVKTSKSTHIDLKQGKISPPPIPQQPQQEQEQEQERRPSKSRNLFGSLRQATRSKTLQHSKNSASAGIKGLVRNLSTAGQNHNKQDHNIENGMSRAAMAVIQHNVAKREKKKSISTASGEKEKNSVTETIKHQTPNTDNYQSTGKLISQLIARATSSSIKQKITNNTTKIVNMENEKSDGAKKRTQVVRRTIIYVQPDSLHDLLMNRANGSNGFNRSPPPVPPVPQLPVRSKSNTIRANTNTVVSSDGSFDEETIHSKEYATATKIVRQTSVRKRVVETKEEKKEFGSSSPLSSAKLNREEPITATSANSKKRYQIQSMEETELIQQASNADLVNSNEYLEGLELREMSDGSIVWGIVKKQGSRKSFYAPSEHYVEEEEEEEEEEETGGDNVIKRGHSKNLSNTDSNILTTPPPLPRRSPRRQQSNRLKTNVYYSNQVSIPNLLKMMQFQQHPGDEEEEEEDFNNIQHGFNENAMVSVDDQLDEMMRILTSQQQQQTL